MRRGARNIVIALVALVILASFLLAGCTKYAKEEQLQALDESGASALAVEKKIAEKEQEKAELQRRLAEKQEELKKVQAEKAKVQSKL